MCKKKKQNNIRFEDVSVINIEKPLGKVFYLDFSKNLDKKFV